MCGPQSLEKATPIECQRCGHEFDAEESEVFELSGCFATRCPECVATIDVITGEPIGSVVTTNCFELVNE